jgi:hypothetical protein
MLLIQMCCCDVATVKLAQRCQLQVAVTHWMPLRHPLPPTPPCPSVVLAQPPLLALLRYHGHNRVLS